MIQPRPLYIVVSGPPGSGKTTLATEIAQRMHLPLLAKDLIKEALMSALSVPDVDTSKRVGRAAVEVIFAVAAKMGSGAVLEANFHRSIAGPDIGALPGEVIEVFCRCDREVALVRYRQRTASRHHGHFDDRRTDDELWSQEVTQPVAGNWAVLEVDTNQPVEISMLINDIDELVEEIPPGARHNRRAGAALRDAERESSHET